MTQPIISWMDATHSNEIKTPFDYKVIDADSKSDIFIFNVWNNKNGASDVSKMEDCTITTRDMTGGTGDTAAHDVEVVKNNWFHVQVDSLGRQTWKKKVLVLVRIFPNPSEQQVRQPKTIREPLMQHHLLRE
ncbi:hypothetical protein [Paenibacillus sp. PCH8]|uniref:hypothetical protein n=1 Tax=Paenibacillus sp. PCH8 TaxID=2066524 RepID=UPI002157C228|nr:hypothetical protein [Paenibacillus sp. PCH8]